MHLVSIIIPAYNAGEFISKALESILHQTWTNWEAIIVNDGSIDNTEAIVKRYAEEDDRIILVSQSNRGCSPAKNVGLGLAKGDFIQYLDADDILEKDKIKLQVEALLASGGNAVAVGKTVMFSEDSQLSNFSDLPEIDTEFLYTTEDIHGFLLNLYGLHGKRGMIQPNAFLVPKSIIQESGVWDESISPSPDEDGEYFCRILLHARKVVFVPGSINYYRKPQRGGSNLSSQHSEKHVKGALRSIDLKADNLAQFVADKRLNEVLGLQYAEFIYLYFPQYKELCREAFAKVKKLGIRKMPNAGGRKFRILSAIFGFENALRIRNRFGNHS